MHQDPPQTRIVLIDYISHGINGHLRAEQHHERFHHQGETAAFPGPRHLYLMDSVGATPGARHLGDQLATVLEKVHMPPASFDGVVDSTGSFTDWTLEMFPRHVLESQFQAFRFSLEAAFGHSPLPTQSQCCGKKFLRCHSFLLSPRSPEMQIHPPFCFPRVPTAFAVESLERGTSYGLSNAKGSNLPSAERSLLKR